MRHNPIARLKLQLQIICAVALWMVTAAIATAQSRKDIAAFFYGNSLVNHVDGGAQTTVPYWLHQLAVADGNGFAADGTFGFLRNFSANLPPDPNWEIKGVPKVWDTRNFAFRRAGFNTIVINPANFIQYQPPEAQYDGENPRNESPMTATLRVTNWTETKARGAQFYIYEGWADMGGIAPEFPPSSKQLAKYHAANLGDYHAWYERYVAALAREKPSLEIKLIPVASVLARLFSETKLAGLTGTDLYTDNAPHGTPTLYFLASLVSYSTLFNRPPPAEIDLPDVIHPLVRDNLAEIAGFVWAAASGAVIHEDAKGQTGENGQVEPQLAMGLNGVADWSSQQPFVDVMKTARPWIGHLAGQWGGVDAAMLEAAGHLNAEGWPISIPPNVTRLEALVLTDLPAGETSVAGRYRVQYKGKGSLTVVGSARNASYEPQEIWFDFSPGEGGVALSLSDTDAADPIRDITLVREDQIPFFEIGVMFNPDWIRHVRDLRSVRFMDWMYTNASPVRQWDERALPSDYTFVRRGVPLEVMLRLSNEIGADPWFNIPHMADDAYVAEFAVMVRDGLKPALKAYIEYSNEMWNFIFSQTLWAQEQAQARWGAAAGQDGWMQFAGMRAAQVMAIWGDVFGADAETRLIRVVGVHTGWPGLEEPLLEAPLFVAENPAVNQPPARSFDAYAVSGYFGYEMGTEEFAPDVIGWIGQDDAANRMATALRRGSLKELVTDVWPYHAGVAKRYGMDMVMYEGGTHVAGHEVWADNEDLTAFFIAFNYSDEMAQLYAELLAAWRKAGGTLFNAFVDVSKPSKWGSWGALRHNDDMNPRWATLMAYNTASATPWEDRKAGAFDNGVTRWAAKAGGTVTGTPLGDVLVGGEGNDVFVSLGGNDRIHGGNGQDRVELPGAGADYALGWQGQTLVVDGPTGQMVFAGIEELVFADSPNQVMAISPPN